MRASKHACTCWGSLAQNRGCKYLFFGVFLRWFSNFWNASMLTSLKTCENKQSITKLNKCSPWPSPMSPWPSTMGRLVCGIYSAGLHCLELSWPILHHPTTRNAGSDTVTILDQHPCLNLNEHIASKSFSFNGIIRHPNQHFQCEGAHFVVVVEGCYHALAGSLALIWLRTQKSKENMHASLCICMRACVCVCARVCALEKGN